MAISEEQKAAIEDIIASLEKVTQGGRYKRHLIGAFLDLPDGESFPDYYEVITNPRCINGVKEELKTGGYNECMDAFKDLETIFLNALNYNEDTSGIYADAEKFRYLLDSEWRAREVLPAPPQPPPREREELEPEPTPTAKTRSRNQPALAHAPPPPPPEILMGVPPVTATPPPFRTVAPRPRSPSAEVDIDGERGTPDPDAAAEEDARDEDSHAIVSQLEKGVPRWQGLEDVGFNEDLTADRFIELVNMIKTHKNSATGTREAIALEGMPDDARVEELPFIPNLSLKAIEAQAQSRGFESSAAFDKTMMQLFLKGRRYYESGSEQYGRVCLLQRLYQSLTSDSPPTGPPYDSNTNFSSVRAGPGTARPMFGPGQESNASAHENMPGVTTFRVSSKDRSFVDELLFKGWRLRLGDWVHASNPDDPSRPIVGQVYRCYVSDEQATRGKPGMTVCWYYRAEQTIHPAHRVFWEHEVFKTSHFADHSLDDLIERIAVQFTARHIRGRPRPPYWYPGWPLYICDSRYNDRERCFVKIKNWSSCVPEEVRKRQDWMPIYPFERHVYPCRIPSPFVKGRVKGPGSIGDSVERGEGEKIEGGGTGRKRARKGGSGSSTITDTYGPAKGVYVGSPQYAPKHPQPAPAQSPYAYSQQMAATPQPQYPAHGQSVPPALEDRSIIQAAGGANMAGIPDLRKLPPEMVKLFDRDGHTNELLWFSAPPVNVSQDPGPRHSLKYLHFLAHKRKEEERMGGADRGAAKRARIEVPPTFTEQARQIFADIPMDT